MELTLHGQWWEESCSTREDALIAGAAGFDGLEAIATRRACAEPAIPVRMMNYLFVRSLPQATRDLWPIIDDMNEMGTRTLQAVIWPPPRGVLPALREAVPGHVELAVEPVSFHPHSLGDYVDAARDLPGVGLCLDTWHLEGMGASPDEVRGIPRELIGHVHVADGYGLDVDGQRDCLPGDGVVPLVAWIEAIRETGYDGTYGAEVLGASRTPLTDAIEIHKRLTHLLGLQRSPDALG